MLLEVAYSYSISGSIDQGNDSGINHELKLINNHKNYIHLERYTQTHWKIKKKGLDKCGRKKEREDKDKCERKKGKERESVWKKERERWFNVLRGVNSG